MFNAFNRISFCTASEIKLFLNNKFCLLLIISIAKKIFAVTRSFQQRYAIFQQHNLFLIALSC